MKIIIEVIEEYNPDWLVYTKKIKHKKEIFNIGQSVKVVINRLGLLNKKLLISDKEIKNYDFVLEYSFKNYHPNVDDSNIYYFLEINHFYNYNLSINFCKEDFYKIFKNEPKEIFIKVLEKK